MQEPALPVVLLKNREIRTIMVVLDKTGIYNRRFVVDMRKYNRVCGMYEGTQEDTADMY